MNYNGARLRRERPEDPPPTEREHVRFILDHEYDLQGRMFPSGECVERQANDAIRSGDQERIARSTQVCVKVREGAYDRAKPLSDRVLDPGECIDRVERLPSGLARYWRECRAW